MIVLVISGILIIIWSNHTDHELFILLQIYLLFMVLVGTICPELFHILGYDAKYDIVSVHSGEIVLIKYGILIIGLKQSYWSWIIYFIANIFIIHGINKYEMYIPSKHIVSTIEIKNTSKTIIFQNVL